MPYRIKAICASSIRCRSDGSSGACSRATCFPSSVARELGADEGGGSEPTTRNPEPAHPNHMLATTAASTPTLPLQTHCRRFPLFPSEGERGKCAPEHPLVTR